jgi:hypothetical protein
MSETHILIRLLWMYFPWNWEFSSALSKLWNFGGGGWNPPLDMPLGQGTTNTYDLCVRSMWLDQLTTLQPCVFWFTSAVTLHAVTFAIGTWGTRLHPSATIKQLRTLLLWAFNHNLIPQLLLTAWLGLGIITLVIAMLLIKKFFCGFAEFWNLRNSLLLPKV